MGWIAFVVGAVITLCLLPLIFRMLQDSGLMRPNFCGEEIPLSMGIVFVLGSMIASGSILILKKIVLWYGVNGEWQKSICAIDSQTGILFILAICSMGLLGNIDDFLGSRAASGLKGHFLMLFKERQLTTGALKALMGGFIALVISAFFAEGLWSWILNAFILALSTNAFNLLDLRPGRAIKFFLMAMLMFLFVLRDNADLVFLATMVGAVLVYFPIDLHAKAMMGDVGSNVLGICVGMSMIWTFSLWLRLVFLILLISFHIFTEKYSLSQVIAKNYLLNAFDQLGRRKS